MTEVIGRNQLATRRRILDEYRKVQKQIARNPELWRKLSFDAHKELCEVLGDDFIDYPEFDFWFSRFVRGNFELDYDRRSDPKTRSFTDLPLDVFEKVGEYLELEDRMELRNVCKDIRAHVDNWNPKITEFWFIPESNFFLDEYAETPETPIREIADDQQDDYWKKFIRELDESNQKLHVKKVEFRYNHSAKNNWLFMLPGVLEKIILIDPTRGSSWDVTSRFPLDALYNCPRFTLLLGGAPACSLKAPFLKRLMKYGEVQTCVLYNSNYLAGPRLTLKYLNEPEAMVPNFPLLRRYPIPETNEFYELEYQEDRECREELGHRGRWSHKEFVRLERKQ